MAITDILATGGGIQAVAEQLGISEADASRGAAALLPAILGGFKTQAQAQPAGVGELLGQTGGVALDSLTGPQPTDVGLGNGILGQIFGTKDVSRTVAQSASAQTGLDPALLKRMLPLLAMLVTGYLARRQGAAPGQAGTPAPAGQGGLGGLGGMLGGMLGGRAGGSGGGSGGLASILDLDGDGNPLDDILKMAGQARR
ncbi:MAG TPA: DUF937 domain-containing protein [Longimicrobiaceae bacterium]|nr:DUF937 domain-containing protein [Longimicrobiaceae bacterium]